MEILLCTVLLIILAYGIVRILQDFVIPKITVKSMKEIEKNPKWIMSKVNCYGFQDIDIILTESKFGGLPCTRVTKENRFQLLIPSDTSTKDIDEVIRLALVGKIYVKHGVFFPNKPLQWLSILCYMLDGNDIYEAKN